jgi:hypothetical protein
MSCTFPTHVDRRPVFTYIGVALACTTDQPPCLNYKSLRRTPYTLLNSSPATKPTPPSPSPLPPAHLPLSFTLILAPTELPSFISYARNLTLAKLPQVISRQPRATSVHFKMKTSVISAALVGAAMAQLQTFPACEVCDLASACAPRNN